MDSASGNTRGTTCEIRLQGAGCLSSDSGDRILKLETPNERIHIGRASKRHLERGSPAHHNALYNSAVVSRDHAVIYFEDSKVTGTIKLRDDSTNAHKVNLLDRSSTHGTYVNGQRLRSQEPKQLAVGDIVTLGSDVKTTAGQTHNSVSFEVEFIFQQHAQTILMSESPVKTASNDAELYSTSPSATRFDIPIEAKLSQRTSDILSPSSSSRKPKVAPIFCVPSDSDDMSEDSESDWYQRFEMRKSQLGSPSQALFIDEPPILVTSTVAPITTTASNESLSSRSSSPSKQIRVELPPLSDQEPYEDISICVNHNQIQQVKPESTFSGAERSDSTTVCVKEEPKALAACVSGAANDINSSREKLSIPNLLTSPSIYLHDGSRLRDSRVAPSTFDDFTSDTLNILSCDHPSADAHSIDVADGGNTSRLNSQASENNTPVRKRRSNFDQEIDEVRLQTLEDAESRASVLHIENSQEAGEPAPKRLCLDLESGKSTYIPQMQTKREFLYSNHQGNFSSTASFVLGTFIGGVAVLGGLMALPDALFS